MRSLDFAPFVRSTVGFDRMLKLLENTLQVTDQSASPPYNIEKTGEDAYRVTLAVAGFAPEELTVTIQQNLLIVTGRKSANDNVQYLHRGLPNEAFERRFNLADFLKVVGAKFDAGLLSIDLVREVPEEMKPRAIRIESKPSRQHQTIEHKAA
jgi:molecular chaperone IbpA